MIFKNKKVLLCRRKSSHGEGEYAFPGGHLEYMESFEDCARRETKEECGIEIKNIAFSSVANVKKYAPKHYVNIELTAEWAAGEPKITEPEKWEGEWEWYDIDKLPQPIFEFSQCAIDTLKSGKNYYDNL